ncbi:cytidine deaminase [Hymenobacter busanensis]|uniref:Cytidine deaminase n=1 Tax=Hymenobacter busanensis TaxID=2607656 RepID=A0A7L4ZWL8_9BACT|nr:cytidine deaminase [Hymenobacter busanensis]KAA9339643.1 cytidine deaminase [Hymenobacter busanensis]QHJ06602.1 cytidine deaminase [Hymenobacter busanensis]
MAQTLNLTITADVLTEAELSPAEARCWQAAQAATALSYSPYSHFQVGAALLLDDDSIASNANQENAAYPSGLCAERTVLFGMASQPGRTIRCMAVAARPQGGEFVAVTSCGACRQVMAEFEQRQADPIPLLLPGPDGTIWRFRRLTDLLPFQFMADVLPARS